MPQRRFGGESQYHNAGLVVRFQYHDARLGEESQCHNAGLVSAISQRRFSDDWAPLNFATGLVEKQIPILKFMEFALHLRHSK